MTKKMMLALVAMSSVAVLAGCGMHSDEVTTEETMTGEVMEVVMTGDDVVVETMEEATPATEEATPAAEEVAVEETAVETPAEVVVDEVAAQ